MGNVQFFLLLLCYAKRDFFLLLRIFLTIRVHYTGLFQYVKENVVLPMKYTVENVWTGNIKFTLCLAFYSLVWLEVETWLWKYLSYTLLHCVLLQGQRWVDFHVFFYDYSSKSVVNIKSWLKNDLDTWTRLPLISKKDAQINSSLAPP